MSKPLETMEKSAGDTPSSAARPASQGGHRNAPRASQTRGGAGARRNVAIADEDDESFFQRNRAGIVISAVVLLAGGWVAFHLPSGKSRPVQKAPEVTMVRLALPPPPPPPPPKILPSPPPKEEKQPEQAPLAPPDKPAEEKPKPVDKPPEGLGTNIKGAGEGLAGLGSGNGNGMLGGTGSGPGGGSMSAWYAGQVQGKIADELRRHEKTRKASISGLKFSVSIDATGRISRVVLMGSTGDGQLDKAIETEVLTGLQLKEPPPGGKPMTIRMVLNERRQH